MYKKILFISLFLCLIYSFSLSVLADNQQDALRYKEAGIKFSKQGNYDLAIQNFKKAISLELIMILALPILLRTSMIWQ